MTTSSGDGSDISNFKVSRMQQRRGLHVDLPQPLNQGECGLCLDTNRLFIGGDQTQIPPAVQVFPDFYTSVQSIISQQIIEVTVDDITLDFDSFVTYMATYVADTNILANNDGTVFIAISSAQVSSYSTIAAYINAYDDLAPDPSILAVNQGIGKTVDASGVFGMSTHVDAGIVATLINALAEQAVVNEKANIEVYTEYSLPSSSDVTFKYLTLPAASTFTSLNTLSTNFSFDSDTTDCITITYSVVPSGAAWKAKGTLDIILLGDGTGDVSQTVHYFNTTSSEVTFMLTSSDNTHYVLQYKNTDAGSVTLSYKIEAWRTVSGT